MSPVFQELPDRASRCGGRNYSEVSAAARLHRGSVCFPKFRVLPRGAHGAGPCFPRAGRPVIPGHSAGGTARGQPPGVGAGGAPRGTPRPVPVPPRGFLRAPGVGVAAGAASRARVCLRCQPRVGPVREEGRMAAPVSAGRLPRAGGRGGRGWGGGGRGLGVRGGGGERGAAELRRAAAPPLRRPGPGPQPRRARPRAAPSRGLPAAAAPRPAPLRPGAQAAPPPPLLPPGRPAPPRRAMRSCFCLRRGSRDPAPAARATHDVCSDWAL